MTRTEALRGRRPIVAVIAAVGALAALALGGAAQTAGQTVAQHVVLVTIDGLRWQEFFGGADRDYFKRDENGNGVPAQRRFWRATAEERRAALLPFVWTTVASQGQVFGDAVVGGTSRVTNGLWFSYPGYSEMFAGVADPRIDSNDKVPNPNITVFEWLNTRPGFERRVAAFGAWDVLPFILNTARSGIPVGTGWQPMPSPATERDRAINELAADLPRYWEYGAFDAPFVEAALETLRTRKPRALYLMLGEVDEWAHEGRYDLYLDAAWRSDRFVERLWSTLQAMPDYAGRTALVLATDHGRGATPKDWSDHGRKVPAAERTWVAVLGPGVPALGVRRHVAVTNAQIAATVAALVGEDFRRAVPAAAAPIDFSR